MHDKDLYIVIPAYNEAGKIKEVIADLQKRGYKNIVTVDDGSTDDTYKILSETKGIHVLHHIINRGAGAATQTGIEYSLKCGAKYIALCDADGQFDPEDLPKLLRAVKDGNDIALGTRFKGDVKESNVPLSKKIGLRVGILFTWIISGIWLSDTHNGFKVMNVNAAKEMKFLQNRFEFCSEILDIVKAKKLKYIEVPIKVIYSEYSKRKGQKLSNGIIIVKNMLLQKLYDILFHK